MRTICCALTILFMSCEGPNHNYEQSYDLKDIRKIEICHNPESLNHKQECSPDCFEPNLGQNSFCWTLEASDCEHPREYQWQQESCHFFD